MKVFLPISLALLLSASACTSLGISPGAPTSSPGTSTKPTNPQNSTSNSSTVSTPSKSCNPRSSLIANYKLEGNTEAANNPALKGSILDSSVSPTVDRFGHNGGAMAFTPNGYIEIPVNLNPSVYPKLTLTAWARFTGKEVPSSSTVQVLSHDDGDYDRSLGIDYRGNTVGWSAFAGEGGVLGAANVVPGKWVFLAAVYDQEAKTTVLYVNNERFMAKGALGEGSKTARIGSNPGFGEFFTGDIDDVKIYGDALTDQDIFEIRDCV